KIFKEAGARYVTFTSKHHEGFCMFDSTLTDYDSVDRAPHKDFVKELIDAARKADMKISFYYSTLDWAHPDFKKDLSQYVDEYLFGQVRELCTNYGPIDGIWFDGEWDHPAEIWKATDLVSMIHELQPGALVNDRIGKGERGKTTLADFYTREQPVEILKKTETEARKPWEACLTIGESWGYRRNDTNLKSTEELIRFLIDVASRGGNLLLNVGPTPEGEIPAPLVKRILGIGEWLKKNGDSIYGTYASPFASLPYGKCTTKDDTLYLHLESNPGTPLELPGLKNNIENVHFLETGEALDFDNETNSIQLPKELPDPVVTVVAVELDGEPRVE
ncbi:MAG: alpha-L-fucosidase, partial [Candidatus Omnitrophica bacterium]|nr:alpha-L-fucosidase [Candidatus Omnitrophota bacterium]